jgi:hypothetical protein
MAAQLQALQVHAAVCSDAVGVFWAALPRNIGAFHASSRIDAFVRCIFKISTVQGSCIVQTIR